jgi:hypothetical protein
MRQSITVYIICIYCWLIFKIGYHCSMCYHYSITRVYKRFYKILHLGSRHDYTVHLLLVMKTNGYLNKEIAFGFINMFSLVTVMRLEEHLQISHRILHFHATHWFTLINQ